MNEQTSLAYLGQAGPGGPPPPYDRKLNNSFGLIIGRPHFEGES